MAIVKFATPISGLRGTIGGVTYSANKSGPHVKTWARGANPRTGPQSLQRARVAVMATLWRALSDGQRDDWDTFAGLPAQEKTNSLNETYEVSGFAWFVTLNSRLDYAGLTLLEDAPAGVAPAAPVITALVFEDNAGAPLVQATYGVGEFAADETIVIFVALIPSGGRSRQTSGFWCLAAEENPGASPYDLSTPFTGQFGIPNTGDRAFVRIFKQSDEGQRSPEFADFADYS